MSTGNVPVPAARSGPILVAAMALGAGIGLIFPLLAQFQDRYGFSAAGLGLISGASFLAALVSGVLLAGLADRGHARLLLVGGLVLSAAGLFWFAIGTELWQFVGARLLEGLGAGVYFPAARKIITVGDPAHAGRRLGTLTSAELGGFLLGPVIGSALTVLIGLDAPFVLIGVIKLGLAAWLMTVPLPPVEVDRRRASPLGSITMLRRPAVSGAALLSLALFLPVGVYDAMWSRYLTDRGAGTVFIGVGLSLYAVPVILLAPRGGRVADRIGPVRAATWALVLIIPATVAYGILVWPVAITIVAVLEGIPQAVAGPAVQTAMLQACRPPEVAAGQGLANAVNQVGAATAALAAPVVYEATSSVVVFVGVGVLMALMFGLGLVLHRRGERSRPDLDQRPLAT
jgi:predicted MFS family arabinose efflux permease